MLIIVLDRGTKSDRNDGNETEKAKKENELHKKSNDAYKKMSAIIRKQEGK